LPIRKEAGFAISLGAVAAVWFFWSNADDDEDQDESTGDELGNAH